MPFRKLSRYNRETGDSPTPSGSAPGSSGFSVSNRVFKLATLVVGPLTGGIVLLPLIIRIPINVRLNDADLQALSQITASLSAFMIAVPLFLKDLHRGSSFWQQFFLIACTFILATGAGVIAFLRNTQEVTMTGTVWLIVAFTVSVMANTAAAFIAPGKGSPIRLRLSPEVTFVLTLLMLAAAAVSAAGDTTTVVFLLLSLYGFYLTLILITAILVQIYQNSLESLTVGSTGADHDDLLRNAIAELANKYVDHALTETELLRRLKTEKFPQTPNIVSDTAVELLVAIMDADTNPGHALISIYEHDRIIPRWTQQREAEIAGSGPTGIVLPYEGTQNDRVFRELLEDPKRITDKYNKDILQALSASNDYSFELLTHNITWPDKYQMVRFMYRHIGEYSKSNMILFIAKQQIEWFEKAFPLSNNGFHFSEQNWITFNTHYPNSIFIPENLRKYLSMPQSREDA